MKYKELIQRILQYYLLGIVIAFVVLLLTSWLASIYVNEIIGILTPRVIRWICSNIVANFSTVPLAKILLGLMSISVLRESGIFKVLRGHLSLKQKRALQITGISAATILLFFSMLLFLPNALLLSAFGTIEDSAFTKGLYGLVACYIIIVGNVYGYTSGRFIRISDFIHAHTRIFSVVANYFVILFLASQFVCCLEFTDVFSLFSSGETCLFAFRCFLYYAPLVLYIVLAFLR